MGDRRGAVLVAFGVLGSAVVVLALALLLAGGAPIRHPGLPSAPGVVLWLLAVAPLAHLVLGTSTVAAGLLVGGHLGEPTGTARGIALVWGATSLLTFVLLGVEQHALGVPVSQFPASPQANGLFMAVLVAGFTSYAAPSAPRAVAPLAVLGLLPPLLTGHVRTAEVPWLTGSALVVHVGAAATWVAGLVAVGWLLLRGRPWGRALRAYSPIALVATTLVALSGTVVAVSRVGSPSDLVGSGYGLIVLAKVAALGVLIACGYLQRRVVLASDASPRRAFLMICGAELTVMSVTFALAAALSQTPPP
jgi:Copper resistance protein D